MNNIPLGDIDVYLIGVLANESKLNSNYPGRSRAKVNTKNTIQFYIEIINDNDLPFDKPSTNSDIFFTGYGTSIKSDEWFDDISQMSGQHLREQEFLDFAENKIFIFKPYIDKNDYGDYQFKVSNNSGIRVINRPSGISENNDLISLPIFKDYSRLDFEERILNRKSLGQVENFDVVDMPSCIINGDYIYGEFQLAEKLNDGWHFEFEDTIKKIALDLDEYKDYIIKTSNAVFFDYYFFDTYILEWIKSEGEVVSLKKRPKQLQINEIDIEQEYYVDENQFITYLNSTAKNQGLIYNLETLINFHTALKTGSLVILSGMSGVGKSQLIYTYANSLGINKKDSSQLKMIPVKPNWKDDSDLIGFLDTINNIYRPAETGLIDTLIDAQKASNKDNLYIICFDEMNLARVEHYFAQFLSVLEMPINERKITLYNKKFIGRVLNGEQYPDEVLIGKNVLFTGTINIDESTYHFSDKVLDRANLIEFSTFTDHIEIWSNKYKNTELMPVDSEVLRIRYSDFNEWIFKEKKIVLSDKELLFLQELHNLLIKIDVTKGIGFRVLEHINSFIANIPTQEALNRSTAFDLQISQKILPKIRGSFEELNTLLGAEDNESIITLFNNYQEISGFVKSRELITKKQKELKFHGYTY